ncbi:MAG TPA: hypothetical protein VG941_00630 [Candidatus Paceibacterota bacterium]|nr:hypothetical protein [Candidatus Paceibacterota bacterium]
MPKKKILARIKTLTRKIFPSEPAAPASSAPRSEVRREEHPLTASGASHARAARADALHARAVKRLAELGIEPHDSRRIRRRQRAFP